MPVLRAEPGHQHVGRAGSGHCTNAATQLAQRGDPLGGRHRDTVGHPEPEGDNRNSGTMHPHSFADGPRACAGSPIKAAVPSGVRLGVGGCSGDEPAPPPGVVFAGRAGG